MASLICVGRDALCERLQKYAFREHVVFFLGGPHSGKRTVIEGIQRAWATPVGAVQKGGVLQLVVRCHARDQKVPATAMEFCRLIEAKLRAAVLTHFPGLLLASPPIPEEGLAWKWFFDSVRGIVVAAEPTALHILTVIEQADTFLGSEAYGDELIDGLLHEMRFVDQDIGHESRIAFVAAGRIGLFNVLFKARTSGPSPVSTMAAPEYCGNLDLPGVEALLAALAPRLKQRHELARLVFQQTGGQAALSRRLCEELANQGRAAAAGPAFGKWLAALAPTLQDYCHLHVNGLHKNTQLAYVAYELLKRHEVVDRATLRAKLTELGGLETQDGFAGQIVAAHGMAGYDPVTGTLRRVNAMFWNKAIDGGCEAPSPAIVGSKGAPLAPSPSPQKRHCVYGRTENGWQLWLNGKPEHVSASTDLQYLYAMLEKPGVWFTWLDLFKACHPDGTVYEDKKESYRDAASAALRRLQRDILPGRTPAFARYFDARLERDSGGGRARESRRRYTGQAWRKLTA